MIVTRCGDDWNILFQVIPKPSARKILPEQYDITDVYILMMDALSKPVFNLNQNITLGILRNGTLQNHQAFEFWRSLVTGTNSGPSIFICKL